jgi:glycosyltransferase involved in cell wall biosynthesis
MTAPLRVVHAVPAIAHEASGPSYSVPALCEALASSGADVSLHVLGDATRALGRGFSVVTYRGWAFPPRLGISPAMHRGLNRAAREADVMHNHSLWMAPNVYPGFAVRGTRCLLVTSTRGTFAPWALRKSRWRKRILWQAIQGPSTRQSACFHATAEAEYGDIRQAGLRAPVAVIPNGIDLPDVDSVVAEPKEHRRRLLFLGRIHPVKNLEVLLRAWKVVAPEHADWELTIAGVDEGDYGDRMRALAGDLGLPRVAFVGPRFGAAKLAAYKSADLFVLPTHSENFGMAVAEALAMRVPAIVTRGAPWAGLDTEGCGWWIEAGLSPLVEALRSAMREPEEELARRGARGRAWMARAYGWPAIGEQMAATYRWLVSGAPRPAWVHLT